MYAVYFFLVAVMFPLPTVARSIHFVMHVFFCWVINRHGGCQNISTVTAINSKRLLYKPPSLRLTNCVLPCRKTFFGRPIQAKEYAINWRRTDPRLRWHIRHDLFIPTIDGFRDSQAHLVFIVPNLPSRFQTLQPMIDWAPHFGHSSFGFPNVHTVSSRSKLGEKEKSTSRKA